MNRNRGIGTVLGIGAVALGVCVGAAIWGVTSTASAQPTTKTGTRMAFINLNETLKGYTKFKTFRESLKAKDQQYMDTIVAKQKRIETLMTEAKDPKTTAQRKDQIENEMKAIKFEMEQIKTEAQKTIGRMYEEELAKAYWEVYWVVQEHCKQNGIDMVLRYNEEWGDDYNQPSKVAYRMQAPFWLMYYDRENHDITKHVVTALNQKYTAKTGAAAPAAGTNSGVVPTSGNK